MTTTIKTHRKLFAAFLAAAAAALSLSAAAQIPEPDGHRADRLERDPRGDRRATTCSSPATTR